MESALLVPSLVEEIYSYGGTPLTVPRAFYVVFLIAGLMFVQNTALLAQGKRVALVIGNSSYLHTAQLENPKNDAADMAAALKALGFQVIEGRDLAKAAMDHKIRDFAEALTGATAALFFYAGHGLQVGGQNYLVPTDARLASAAGIDFELVRLDLIHRAMEREAPTNIIFLDACRDNPLTRNLARALGTRSTQIGKGLAATESGEGTLISFSTQPGNVAYDGEGRNSPFAKALLKHISAPGDDLPSILIRVRNDVMKDTARRQVPWEHSALTAPFYFSPKSTSSAPDPALKEQVELSFWNTVKDSNDPNVIKTYLERFPTGTFSALARALIDQHERQSKAAQAARDEEARRQEEQRKAAEIRRIEEMRKAKEASLADAARRAREQKDDKEVERLRERRQSEETAQAELLRKALEEVRTAREAARLAEEQREAAQAAADQARKAAEKAKSDADARAGSDRERVRLAAMPKMPTPGGSSGPFDGSWSVTRYGQGRCGRGSTYTFPVYIVNSVVNNGRGSVTAGGIFKFTGRGMDGQPSQFNGTIRGASGSGNFHHPTCQGTYTMKRQ